MLQLESTGARLEEEQTDEGGFDVMAFWHAFCSAAARD
jgi:hypothetical protein